MRFYESKKYDWHEYVTLHTSSRKLFVIQKIHFFNLIDLIRGFIPNSAFWGMKRLTNIKPNSHRNVTISFQGTDVSKPLCFSRGLFSVP